MTGYAAPDNGDFSPAKPVQSRLWVFFLLVLLGISQGCSAERRDRDMDLFFRERRDDLMKLQTGFMALQRQSGIRGLNREDGKVYLAGTDSLSMKEARERFPALATDIERIAGMETALGVRNAYLLADGSFWVIVDETDVLGSDFGFLHLGTKPVSVYGILSESRPLGDAGGWWVIKF